MKKLILGAAVALLFASPVLAASVQSQNKSGLTAKAQTTTKTTKKAVRAKRLTPAPSNPNSPESCGGGSTGYNEGCSVR